MLQIRRILFPTDFSECAEGAFTHAAYLAQRAGAELHVLHVAEPQGQAPQGWADLLRITPEDIAADLDVPIPNSPRGRRAPNEPVPLIDAEVQAPKAAPAILRYVEEHAIDLVVMGTHGRRGMRRMLVGSVAEEVVRLAPCPVFTVGRQGSGGGWAIRRIVAPVDFSEHARLAARHAAALAATYGATLDLLHVVDDRSLPVVEVPFLGSFGISAEDVRLRAQEALEGFAAELEEEVPAVGEVGAFARLGHPAGDVVDFAERQDADLLVMGSHGRTGMERLLMGSVVEFVIRLAPCPVFTVKSFGRSLVGPALRRAQPDPEAAPA